MLNRSMNKWYEKIQQAVINNQNLTDLLDNFNQNDWNNFIENLVRESLPFSIPDFTFDTPIVCFISVFSTLNENSHNLISNIIQSLCNDILLGKLENKYARNAFLISYATPIYIQDVDLLKRIATKDSIEYELRVYAARLIADHLSITPLNWWKKLINNDRESTFTPIAIDSLAVQSSKIAVEFLKELREPLSIDNIDSFEIVITRLLEQILDRKEEINFSLNSFPEWSLDYISELLTLEEFKQLEDLWIRSNEGVITLVEHILRKRNEIKTKLPSKNYPLIIENDEIATKVSKSLLKNDVYRLFIMGDGFGSGLTSRAASIGYRYLEIDKDVFDSVIFIGSNVKSLNDMLLVIKDCLNDESIKSYPGGSDNESITNFVNSFKKSYDLNGKILLLIIDDFHKKNQKDRNEIGSFLVKIQKYCKAIIAIQQNTKIKSPNDLIKGDKNLSDDLTYHSETISLSTNLSYSSFDKILIRQEPYLEQMDLAKKVALISKCYHGNLLATSLALVNGADAEDCPLPQKDPVWFAFKKSIKLLDSSSRDLLVLISIFHSSTIFHDLSLSQEALEHISSVKIDEVKIDKNKVSNILKELKNLELISLNDGPSNSPRITVSDSISSCILKSQELEDSKDEYEDKIFSSLTEYYIKFTGTYGGLDWNSKDNFEKIEIEWYNILAVLEWNGKKFNFNEIKKIWFAVNRFSDLYGHWEDRRKWLDVLTKHYKDYEKNVYARCLASKGWTLTMCGDRFYQEAEEILEMAWALEDIELLTKSYIAHNLTVLYYRRGEEYYGRAVAKIKEQEKLYKIIDDGFNDGTIYITELELKRLYINYIRDKAKIEFLNGNYKNAFPQYSECLQISQEINWERMTSYFHYMLAYTLLNQIQNTSDSEKLNDILIHIAEGVKIASKNNNRRRLAYFKKLYADLLEQKRDPEEKNWHQEAAHDIQVLGLKDPITNLATELN